MPSPLPELSWPSPPVHSGWSGTPKSPASRTPSNHAAGPGQGAGMLRPAGEPTCFVILPANLMPMLTGFVGVSRRGTGR
jgi:hypothetical protein